MGDDLGLFEVVSHPVVEDALATLRDKTVTTMDFRQATERVTPILVLEATRSLPLVDVVIETPLAKTTVRKISKEVVVVVILRAANPQLFPALGFFPGARVGYFGIMRDEETAAPHQYYKKLPVVKDAFVVVFDPMLATGGTLTKALNGIVDGEPAEMVVACVVAAREGVKKIHESFPNVRIVAGALDDELDARKFIVPGLGDFGCRWHGTG